MSLWQTFLTALETGIHKFLPIVTEANHDQPFYDVLTIDNSSGASDLTSAYPVGQNAKNAHGDQSKFFTSKHTLIISKGSGDTGLEIRFNDTHNPNIYTPNVHNIETYTPLELWTNISTLVYLVKAGSSLTVIFEGVEPNEARDAR